MKADLRLAPVVVAGALLTSCDRTGDAFVLVGKSDAPAVSDLGVIEVITADEWDDLGGQEAINQKGLHLTLGAPDTGRKGGATVRFVAPGGSVCVLVDPETVFWAQPQSPTTYATSYVYPDNSSDDGDIDLFAGLSAFYTGSPGVEMGDFEGYYTDSLGQQVSIEYNECLQVGAKSGFDAAHAGRAAVEYCTLQTDDREGVEFTVVLETYSVPLDDASLDFVAAVVGASCSSLALNECTYKGEKFQGDMDAEEYETAVLGLEDAFCLGTDLANYCCDYDDDYPSMCGEEPDAAFCEALSDSAAE